MPPSLLFPYLGCPQLDRWPPVEPPPALTASYRATLNPLGLPAENPKFNLGANEINWSENDLVIFGKRGFLFALH
jgi:hypothetical protein